MPPEVIGHIIEALHTGNYDVDKSSLSRLGRTCRSLYLTVQKPLFEDFELLLRKPKLVESLFTGDELAEERVAVKSLSLYTTRLFLYIKPRARDRLLSERLSPRRVAALVKACSSPELDLTIIFRSDVASPCSHSRDTFSTLGNLPGLECKSLTAVDCSWSMIQPIVGNLRTSLSSFTWLHKPLGTQHHPVRNFELQGLRFDRLRSLYLSFKSVQEIVHWASLRLIKYLDKQLLSLVLQGPCFNDIGSMADVALSDWNFPSLQSFSCRYLPLAIYKKVLIDVPQLKSLELWARDSDPTSLLALAPSTLHFLDLRGLKLKTDPHEAVASGIRQLGNLKACPTLMYRKETEDPMPDCEFELQTDEIRSSVAKHLRDLNISTDDEVLQDCIRLYPGFNHSVRLSGQAS